MTRVGPSSRKAFIRTKEVKYAVILLAFLLATPARAQLVNDSEDESKLYAESKQVNQFFRRFNGEEDESGKRYYPGDKLFESSRLRKKYLKTLFDDSNRGMPDALKIQFVKDVLDGQDASILAFHDAGWFSEVHAKFIVDGKEQSVILFMELEKDHLGSKWVISHVHAEVLNKYFVRDTLKIGRFLHPMSHELDFMNLRKAFADRDSVSQFTVKRFVPDHLSVFLYEIKRGNMKFVTVEEVKFHFFQVKGWYFEVSEFNRPGYNTGWLISNLVQLKSIADKDTMQRYILYEGR